MNEPAPTPGRNRLARLTALLDQARRLDGSERLAFIGRECRGDISLGAELLALLDELRTSDHPLASPSPQAARERHRRLSRLVARARRLGPGERAPFLAQECADDSLLRAEVEAFFAEIGGAANALDMSEMRRAADRAAVGKAAGSERSLGRYTIDGPLARGGMGMLWMARETGSETPVVIKAVLPRGAESAAINQLRKRLRREFKLLLRLEHDNIVRALDWFAEAGEVYLVLEFVAGPSMSSWFDTAPSLAERIAVMRGVAAAVAHAHEHGVIHRDLKPLNVIVSAGLRPKVLDFGLGRAVDSTRLTRAGTALGTLAYMAPEQARALEVDGRADVFSLGLMLARSLGALLPFGARTAYDIYTRLVSAAPIPLDSWLPDEVRDPLGRMLEKDPERRMQSAAEVLEVIDQLAREATVEDGRFALAKAAPASIGRRAPRLPGIERPSVGTAIDGAIARESSAQGASVLLLSPPGAGRSWALHSVAERLRAAGLAARVQAFTGKTWHLSAREFLMPGGSGRDLPPGETSQGAPGTSPGGKRDSPIEEDGPTAESVVDYVGEPSASTPDGRDEDAVRDLLALVAERTAAGTLTFLIDDLHIASAREHAWIEGLAELTRSAPVLLFLAGDIAPEGAGLAGRESYDQLLQRLEKMAHTRVIALEPLAEGALRAALSDLGLPAQVVDRVAAWANGNPAVVNALLALSHEGLSFEHLPTRLPPAIGPALLARWEQVGNDLRDIVKLMVRAGGEMALDSLATASGISRLALRSRLRPLEDRHGWLKVLGERVQLTQPFLAALPALSSPPG